MSRLLSYLAVVLLARAMHQPVAAGPNANARLSLDLIPNGGAGNQRNDGVISGTVSGQGTTIAIEVFATGVTTPLVGMQLRFDFDATLLTFVKTENSAFPFNVPQSTGTDFAVTSPVRLPSSGFLTRAEFTTATDTEVAGREFSIGIASVTLSESVTSRDTLTTTSRIEFNATGPPTPDFDGDGTVGFADFLPFAGQYGAQRGDSRYQAKYDLNSDGAIDFSDFLLFASSYGNTIPPSGSGSTEVEIPDADLRAVISAELYKTRGKARDATITRADMATLTSLPAEQRNINNLTGLEFATNLDTLRLHSNQISDIAALAGLTNLTWLHLYDNQISDITALSGLTNLTFLSLGGNQLSDITALSGLTNLERLYLHGNQLSDIAALSGLTNLTSLYLDGNQLSDITVLAGLTNLERLYLHGNQLSDIAALSTLTNLERLYLHGNQLSDITVLAGLTNLTGLRLSNNQISDITALAGLTKLEFLYLSENEISDIAALSKLTNLERLSLHGNQLSDITALSGLTNLTWLGLSNNQISDISALAGLTNLTALYLENNQISDITALSGLTKLTRLALYDNPLSVTSINTHIPALETRGVWVSWSVFIPDANLRAVIENRLGKARGAPITRADMATLRQIRASNMNITDLRGLEFATNLTTLNLDGNQLSDIAALAGLTNLTALYLENNQVSDIAALAGLTNLTALYLDNNQISDITALLGLTKLWKLDLRNNPLSATSINTHIPALETRGVWVNF